MPKTKRRESRAVVRERKAAQRRRANHRVDLKRKLRAVALAVFLTALGGGLAFEGTSYFTASPAGGAMDAIAELTSQEFVTIPRQSEEALRARWEQIDAWQKQVHSNIAEELRVSPAIPPLLVAGTAAAEIIPDKIHQIVPARRQLELREAADPMLKRGRERSEERRATARSAAF